MRTFSEGVHFFSNLNDFSGPFILEFHKKYLILRKITIKI